MLSLNFLWGFIFIKTGWIGAVCCKKKKRQWKPERTCDLWVTGSTGRGVNDNCSLFYNHQTKFVQMLVSRSLFFQDFNDVTSRDVWYLTPPQLFGDSTAASLPVGFFISTICQTGCRVVWRWWIFDGQQCFPPCFYHRPQFSRLCVNHNMLRRRFLPRSRGAVSRADATGGDVLVDGCSKARVLRK